MRTCIACHASYADSVHRCPACTSRTLSDDELSLWRAREDVAHAQDLVVVKVLEGPVDEAILREMLAEEGIDAFLEIHGLGAMGGLFRAQEGYGVVRVPENQADAARRVVHRYEQGAVDPERGHPGDAPGDDA